LNQDFIAKHWYAHIYEQQENHQYDIEFILQIIQDQIGPAPQNILEVACGGGRIAIPLARAGHNITGFDADEYMLMRCYAKAKGLKNLRIFQADAITGQWGTGYDIVLIAGNFLINIESHDNYALAQETLIANAARALKPGGYLIIDFDLHHDPAAIFNRTGRGQGFTGTDDTGTHGCIVGYGSVYNPITCISTGTNHLELTTNNGEQIIIPRPWHKHIPSQAQVYAWLTNSGLTIEKAYKNFTTEALPAPPDETTKRATLLARKG